MQRRAASLTRSRIFEGTRPLWFGKIGGLPGACTAELPEAERRA